MTHFAMSGNFIAGGWLRRQEPSFISAQTAFGGIANNGVVCNRGQYIKHANEAVDDVRREEAKTNSCLKKTKYIWLKNEENLTESQQISQTKAFKLTH